MVPDDGNFFVKCIRQQLFTTSGQQDEHLQRYAQYHLWSSALLDKKLHANATTAATAAAAAALGSPNVEQAPDADSPEQLLAGAAALESMQHSGGDLDCADGEQQRPIAAGEA